MAQQQEQKDIWSADLYGEKVAPFVATSTDKILAWLDPKPTGKSPNNNYEAQLTI